MVSRTDQNYLTHAVCKLLNTRSLYCTSSKYVYILATDTLKRGSGTVGQNKPNLTHLSLVHSPGPSVVLCALSIAIVYYWTDQLLACWFYLYYFVCFFVLIHDYTLCLTDYPCCNFSYYNYISIWPYYIIIHLTASFQSLHL